MNEMMGARIGYTFFFGKFSDAVGQLQRRCPS